MHGRGYARELVITEHGAYQLAVEHAEIDLDQFDRLLARTSHVPTEAARRCLAEALSLGTEVLEDEPYANWAQELRGASSRGGCRGKLDGGPKRRWPVHDYRATSSYSELATRLDRFSERARPDRDARPVRDGPNA